MNTTIVIVTMLFSIVLLFLIGVSFKPFKWLGQAFKKLAIGALLLFFFNVIFANFGFNIPINLFTVIVSGFLGIFGIISLTAIQWFVL